MCHTLESLITLFLDWTAANRAAGTASGYKRHLDRFAAHTGPVALADLRAHHLLTWGRTWHQIQAVQRLFSWAKNDAELIERNPFCRVRKPPIRGRRRIFSAQEQAKLLRTVRTDFRRLMLASRESLCRPQEVRALTWAELHHDESTAGVVDALPAGRAFFRLTEFKARDRRRDTSAVRIIPISPRLGRLLLRLLRTASNESPLIFQTYKGKAWTKEKIRQRMRTARRRAKIGRDAAGEHVCLYTFRHTGATKACARGVRDRVLADLMGHTTTRTTARYQHLDVPHLLDAMQEIHRRDISTRRRTKNNATAHDQISTPPHNTPAPAAVVSSLNTPPPCQRIPD